MPSPMKEGELLTGISLLFDRLDGLDDLLSLDAQLLLFFCLAGLSAEISTIATIGVVASLGFLEDLVK